MPVRCLIFDAATVSSLASDHRGWQLLAQRCVLGVLGDEPVAAEFAFRLSPEAVGLPVGDPRLFTMAAAAGRCYPNELVHVLGPGGSAAPVESVGGRAVVAATSADVLEALDRLDHAEREAEARPGVGPHPEPWPAGDHLDPALLASGDRRNVTDRFRYWKEGAIVADLAARAHPFHVAVENWRHDRNIGAVVRNANAFGAASVQVIGRRRWNRRGAMATDRYLSVGHLADTTAFVDWAAGEGLAVVGIDNVVGSVPIESTALPRRCVLAFGQEGPGLSSTMIDSAALVCSITQFGSTRSVNAGVASGIAMHVWLQQHALGPNPPPSGEALV